MIFARSWIAVVVFVALVAATLILSGYLGRKTKTADAYFAAHGQVHWFVNGFAFAGDYLSAASFLGICGMIAFTGYDGFLYSIGYLAGWVVALFLVAEPLKRLGRYTFADALNFRFQSRAVRITAAFSTILVSLFYLIPQMVGAGVLIQPLLGFPHYAGVLMVGAVVTLVVVTAGMVSTTWVQFIKGALLLLFCGLLTVAILHRGIKTRPTPSYPDYSPVSLLSLQLPPGAKLKPFENAKFDANYLGVFQDDKYHRIFRKGQSPTGEPVLLPTQVSWIQDGKRFVNGQLQTIDNDFTPTGHASELASGQSETGSLGPLGFLEEIGQSRIVLWSKETVQDSGTKYSLYYPREVAGSEVLRPGLSPTFAGLRHSGFAWAKVDFLSLMLALFCGTASLPHILIRYYTVKDQSAVRKSSVVGIASIGVFYVLTLYLGLGAMTCGNLDPTDSNMAAPLLARSFGELPFACISAIAFTTVLGTVSGLILAASGAVAHDLVDCFAREALSDSEKVRIAKICSVLFGVIAMVFGILFKDLNVSFLVGWAFNVAASANLPALLMSLFWNRTTWQGVVAAVTTGLLSSLAWILVSGDTFSKVYGLDASAALVPFSQPALVTIPLGFVVLVGVSLLTKENPHGDRL